MQNNMEEIWKDIKGYENMYQISNIGQVKSLEHNVQQKNRWGQTISRIQKSRLMKIHINKNGYFRVVLHKNGIEKNYSVHRLVYEAFVGEIPDGMQVNHINEIKTDNRVVNLNLMTPKENSNWGTRNERVSEKQTNGKNSKPVLKIDPISNEIVAEFPSAKEAERQTGFNHINLWCRGERKSADGFIWKYKSVA